MKKSFTAISAVFALLLSSAIASAAQLNVVDDTSNLKISANLDQIILTTYHGLTGITLIAKPSTQGNGITVIRCAYGIEDNMPAAVAIYDLLIRNRTAPTLSITCKGKMGVNGSIASVAPRNAKKESDTRNCKMLGI